MAAVVTVVLQADGLRLRELVPDDIATIAELLGDPEVMAFWPRPLDRAEAAAWIAGQRERYRRDGFGHWLLEDAGKAVPIGQVGLLATMARGRREIELGYILHRRFWGQGYATRAGALALGYAFATLGAAEVIALIRPANQPSRRVADRLGFFPGEEIAHRGLAHIVYARRRTDSPTPVAGREGQGECGALLPPPLPLPGVQPI